MDAGVRKEMPEIYWKASHMEKKETNIYKDGFKEMLSVSDRITDDSMMDYFHNFRTAFNYKNSKSFFRYRRFNEYTLAEIIKQEVYLAKLSEFDDAYEGRYLVDDEDLKNNVNQNKAWDLSERYREDVRCAAFTTNHKNIPMWYYYADKHQGICIEYKYGDFKLDNNLIFLPVIYPRMNEEHDYKFLPENDNQYRFGAAVISLIKNRVWKFENEWRILKVIETSSPPYFPLRMTAIHLGANVSDATKEVIKNVIEKNHLNIELNEMVLTTSGLASIEEGILTKENKVKV